MLYADRLELEETQCEAIRGFHDEYKQQYRNLHDIEILPALRRFVFQQWTQQVDRDDIEQHLARMNTLMRRIRSLDINLFEQMKNVLSQGQLGQLGAIECERERSRLYALFAQASVVSWPIFDLVEVVRGLSLEASDTEVVDPLLTEYERVLTIKFRELAKSAQYGFVDVKLAGRLTIEDGDRTQEDLASSLSDATGPFEEQVQELRKHYLQTYRLIADVLSKQNARQIRGTLCKAVYRDALIVTQKLLGGKEAKIAIASKGLSPEQYESIVANENDRRNRLDPLIEEAILVVHEYYGSTSYVVSRPEIEDVLMQDLNRLVLRAKEVDEQGREKLKAIVGQDLYKKFRTETVSSRSKRQRQHLGSLALRYAGVSEAALVGITKADARLPDPLSSQDLDRYTWLLDATDVQKSVIRVLHQDYIEQYEQHLKAVISSLADTYSKALGPRPELHGISTKDLSREVRTVRQAMFELDDVLFVNIGIALEEEQILQLERVRRARTRELYGFWHTLDSYPIYFSRIDFLWLLRSLGYSPARIIKLNPVLIPYEETLTELLIQMYNHNLERENILLDYHLEVRRLRVAEVNEEQIPAAFEAVHPNLERISERLHALNALIGQLNEQILSSLVGTLSSKDGRRLSVLFNRLAFPTVYRDPTYVGGVLDVTLLNENLPAKVISALEGTNASYQRSYEEITQKIVNVMAEVWKGLLTDDSTTRNERDEILRIHLFERNELNQRVIWRLQTMFRNNDMDQLHGLPDPSKIKEKIWRWQ